MLTRLTVVNILQYIQTSDHYVVLLKLICNSCQLYLNTSPTKPPKCPKHRSQLRSNFLADTWSGTFIKNALHSSVSHLIFLFTHLFLRSWGVNRTCSELFRSRYLDTSDSGLDKQSWRQTAQVWDEGGLSHGHHMREVIIQSACSSSQYLQNVFPHESGVQKEVREVHEANDI